MGRMRLIGQKNKTLTNFATHLMHRQQVAILYRLDYHRLCLLPTQTTTVLILTIFTS